MPYVYQYIDSNTNLPFYIGKGTGSRANAHLAEAKNRIAGRASRSRPTYNIKKIMKMLKEGREPMIVMIQENLTDEEAFAIEERLVDQYGRAGIDENGILTNRDRGGRGGKRDNPEARKALIARNKASKGKLKPGLSAYIAANPEKHISRRQLGTKHTESRREANARTQREKQIGAKILTFMSPSGEITRTQNWREFLIKNGLSYNLVRGKGKIYVKGPNAGWSMINEEYANR